MAPEVIASDGQFASGSKADIWSFGITVIEMVETYPPLYDTIPVSALFKIVNSPPPALKHPAQHSKSLSSLLAQCLCKDPERRPTAADLLYHPFVHDANLDVLNGVLEQALSGKRWFKNTISPVFESFDAALPHKSKP
jgi:serine/threonine protein kinase